MARQGQRPTSPPPATPATPVIGPAAIGGLIGGAPPVAASTAALGATKKVQRDAVVKAVEAVLGMLHALNLRRVRLLRQQIPLTFPQADIEAALAEEARREVIFRKRVEQRVRSGMKLATAAKDPSARAAAIQGVLTRERRFAEQRARASGERVLASAEFQELRTLSPQGAYWSLGPRKEHTPDCIAMNGRFWPWAVLEKVHPLLHVGCGCFLLSFGEAIRRGLMTADAVPTDEAALQMAAPIIKHVEEEEAEAERKYGHLAEGAATEELLARVGLLEHEHDTDPDLLAAMPLAADITTPPAPPWVREAAEHTDGAMVALYPDSRRAKKLALRGGEEPAELHITLAFLGKAEGLDLGKAKAAVAAWAKKTPPQSGQLSGIGHFDLGKGQKATYRSVDLPDIAAPREQLVTDLKTAGTPASEDHGFTPHMTIDYGIRRPPIEKAPIRFSKVTLSWGTDRYDFPLTGK